MSVLVTDKWRRSPRGNSKNPVPGKWDSNKLKDHRRRNERTNLLSGELQTKMKSRMKGKLEEVAPQDLETKESAAAKEIKVRISESLMHQERKKPRL